MRVKDLWKFFPLPAKIRLFWDRITLTRITTIYFVFSVLHCIIQVVFQVQAFQINVQAAEFLASIIEQGNATTSHAFYIFGNDLRLCDNLPTSFSASSCQVIWDGMIGNNTMVLSITSTTSATTDLSLATTLSTATENTTTWKHDKQMLVQRAFVEHDDIETVRINGTALIMVNGFGWNNESATLDTECLWTLGWPVQILRETEREDLAFIMFQIWLLGMSVVAILNESIPHTIASLLTHMIATGWAGFQIFNSAHFRGDFAKVTTNGACHPINLLPSYWQTRSAAEIPSLVLNAMALLISAVLSWVLSKSFGWQTFKRVGASFTIRRVYNVVLMLSIVIQLSLFFIITSIALWLDQLWNGAIGQMATSTLYRPLLTLTLILLPPWLAFGWYSVRQERNLMMLVFLVMCLGYLAGWGAMFDSTSFRWTYMTWTFFGVMTTSSVFLTLLAFVLGVICRLNFGKGLPHYLNAEEPLPNDFEPVVCDLEKVALPPNKDPTPSVALDSEAQVPLQVFVQDPGVRIAQPVRMVSQTSLPQPSPAIVRSSSESSPRDFSRHPSWGSADSSKRWIIE